MVSEEALKQAAELVRNVFSPTAKSPIAPEELPAKLEQTWGWAELLAAVRHPPAGRRLSRSGRRPQEESGVRSALAEPVRLLPAARVRISGRRFPHRAGAPRSTPPACSYANQVQCEIDWWIFWGRVAGGLNRNQQADMYQRLSPFLLPRGGKKPPRLNNSLLREMWRTAASLELLPIGPRRSWARRWSSA